jgi:hypothetical protein
MLKTLNPKPNFMPTNLPPLKPSTHVSWDVYSLKKGKVFGCCGPFYSKASALQYAQELKTTNRKVQVRIYRETEKRTVVLDTLLR